MDEKQNERTQWSKKNENLEDEIYGGVLLAAGA